MKQRIPNKLETNALRTARNAAFVCMCAISCVGCNPNLDVDGALIPAWLIAVILGLLLTIGARALLVRLGIDHADFSSRPDLDPDPSIASFQLAALSPLGPLDRLQALKSVDPDSRLRFLLASIEDQIATLDAIDTLTGEDNASQ